MSKLGEVGARSLAKRKEGEVGALSPAVGSPRSRAMAGDGPRRSPRLIKMKEESQLMERILKLKREMKPLMARQRVFEGIAAGKEAQPAREEPEPEPAGLEKKRKKVVKRRVPHQLIEYMIENPRNTWNRYPQEELVKRSQKFQEFYAKEKVLSDKVLEYEQALIKQYNENGFAVDYTEVSDNEEKN